MIMSTENDTYTICVVFERLLNEISLHIDRGISNASIDSNSNSRNDANIINTVDKDNKDKGANDTDVKLWADLEQLLSSLSSDTLKLLVVKNSSFLNILCYYASVNNYRRDKITWSHSLKCLLLIYSSYDVTMLWQYIDYSADELLSNFFEVYEVISQRYIASSISHHEFCMHTVQCIHAMSKLLNDCDIYNLAAYKSFLDMLSRFMSAFYDSNEQRGTYSGNTFNKLFQSHTFMYTNKVRQCLIITREQELMGQSMVSTSNGQHSNLYNKPLVNNKECFDFLLELMITLCMNKDLLSFPIVVLTMMRSHASISLIPLLSVEDKQVMRKVDQLHKVIGDLLSRLGNVMLLLQVSSPPGMDHHPLISTRGDFIAPLVSIMCSYNPMCRHSAQSCLYILIHNHSPPLQTTSPSSSHNEYMRSPIDIKMILNSTPAIMIKYGSSIVNGLLKVVGDIKNLDLLNSDSPSVDLCKNIDEIIAHTLDFLIARHHAHSFDEMNGSSVKHPDDDNNFDDGDSAMLMAFKDIVSELLSRMSGIRSRPRLIETLVLGLQLGVTAGIRGCDQLLHANKSFLRPAIHITAMRSDEGHVYVSSEKEHIHIPASASSRQGSSQLYTASSIRADPLSSSSSSSSSSSAIIQKTTSAAIRSADVTRPPHQVWSIFKPSTSENNNNSTSAGTLHHTSSSSLPTKHHPKRKHGSSSSYGHGDSAFDRLHRLENAYNEKERKSLLKKRFFGGGQQQQQHYSYDKDDDDEDKEEEEELNFQVYGHEYRSKTGHGYPQSAHLSLSSYSRAPVQQISHSSSSSSSSLKGEEEGVWRSKMKELREAKETARLKMEQSRRLQQQHQMDGGDEITSHRQYPYRNGNSNYLDEGNDDDDGTSIPHPIDRSGNGNNDGNSNRDAENTKHRTVDWRDFIIPADSSSSSTSSGGKKVTVDNGHHRYSGNDIRMHSANLDKLLKAYLSSTNSDAVGVGVGGKNQFDSTLPRHSMVMQPSMAELFEKISIDPMLCKLLKLNLGELAKSIIISSSSSSSDGRAAASKAVKLEKLPLRFMHEENYIELFQPLLLEEFKAAAMSHLSSLQSSSASHSNNHDATSSFRSKKGKGVSSGQVMKGRCILATSRVGCAKLTEVHMQTVFNDGKGGSRNADGTIMHGRGYQSNVLFKDELVLVFSKPLPDGEVSVMALLQRPHALAIVTTSPSKANPNQPRDNNYNYNNNLSNTYNNNNNNNYNNNNNNNSSSSAYIPRQHTLLMLTTQAPIEDLSMWCVTFMSITTHIREWSALMSIRSDRLMPLAPYLLKASPVVSSVSLSSLHDAISLKLRGLNESHDMAISISTDRRDRLNAALLSDLKLVQLVQVDGSVLKNTGIGKTMQKIITNKSGTIAATCVEVADGLVSKWKEQIKADYKVSTLSNMKGGRVIKMPDTIEDITQPKGMSHHLWSQLKQSYNISQLFAIKYISDQFEGGQDTRIALIQGPPGTGKTSTIVGMVASLLSSINAQSSSQSSVRRRLLICAPSNTAIDEILLRLAKGVYDSQGSIRTVRIVRLGDTSEGSMSQSINKLTLDAQIEERLVEDSNWMKLCEAKEGIMCADKEIVALKAIYNRTSATESKLKTLLRDLSTLKQTKLWAEINVERARSLLRHQILYEADVVGSTLSSTGKKQFLDLALRDDIIFDTCIIDEAAQATEPSCLIPLRLGCRRLVLVGDPRQLPATIHSKESNDAGLGTSLFERLERAEHEVVMLTIQYRMHPEIRLFPSLQFYENLLTDAIEIDRDDQSTVRIALPKSKQIDQSLQHLLRYHNNNDDRSAVIQLDPIKFFDIRQSKEYLSGTSYQNDSEVEFIANLLEQILCYLRSYSIAIISPYSSQVRSMKNKMRSNDVISEDQKDRKTRLMEIDVNTIDGFQGREKDIIIFSTVRSDITSNNNHKNSHHHHHGHSSIGFVSDERRLNVAITRAKRLLIIVGNSLTLSRDSTWNNLLSSLYNRGYITTASPTTFNVKNQGEILTQLSSTAPQEVKDRSRLLIAGNNE